MTVSKNLQSNTLGKQTPSSFAASCGVPPLRLAVSLLPFHLLPASLTCCCLLQYLQGQDLLHATTTPSTQCWDAACVLHSRASYATVPIPNITGYAILQCLETIASRLKWHSKDCRTDSCRVLTVCVLTSIFGRGWG